MGYRLIVPQDLWVRLRAHLLADRDEHLAFLLARPAGERLLASDLILVPDGDIEGGQSWDGLSLKLDPLLHVMNTANQRRLALIEAHSHPFSTGKVAFSQIDLEGQEEMAGYLNDVHPGYPYGALVLGKHAVRGQIWPSGETTADPLHEVKEVGSVLRRWPGNGDRPKEMGGHETNSGLYQRQILALGHDGHHSLEHTTVAVVGAGGIGSIVLQQLAHLGVRRFIVVDDDEVEASNLHRVVGTSAGSVGSPKVGVAREHIREINKNAEVETIQTSIRESRALAAVREADVIFGCMDTDSGRLILNELSLADLVPYIDSGVGITVEGGRITEAGGRVVVWVPGRPCLLCCKEISTRIAAEELESPQEREFRQRHGYVQVLCTLVKCI